MTYIPYMLIFLTLVVPILSSFEKPDILIKITNNLTMTNTSSFLLNQLVMLTSGQYLQQGTLSTNFTFSPFPNSTLTFNLLVFNLTDPTSVTQYNTAINNMQAYIQSGYCLDCSEPDCIKNLTSWSVANTYTCCRNCVNQSIETPMMPNTYLDELFNMNLLIVVDPTGNEGPVNVTMKCETMLNTTNAWLYWEVILLSLLIFNLVVLTGVTVHMCFKYKKSAQRLVKHQLTDTNKRPKVQ